MQAKCMLILASLVNVCVSWECSDGEAEKGSAMLQKSSLTSKTQLSLPVRPDVQIFPLSKENITDDFELTQEGFTQLQKGCCLMSFDEYSRRWLFNIGMEICDEGCHEGFIAFFYCEQCKSLQNFTEHITKQSKQECACYAPVGQCAVGGLPWKCLEPWQGKTDPHAHRRRRCDSTTQVPTRELESDALTQDPTEAPPPSEAPTQVPSTGTLTKAPTGEPTGSPIDAPTETPTSSTTISTSTTSTSTSTKTTTTTISTSTTSTSTKTTTTTTSTSTTSTSTTSTSTTLTTTTTHCSPSLLVQANESCQHHMLPTYLPQMIEQWLPKCIDDICEFCSDAAGEALYDCIITTVKDYMMEEIDEDPKEDCTPDLIAHATAACYVELMMNCKVSEEWVDLCVQDVCSAASDPHPLQMAEGYCDNQVDFEDDQTTTTTTPFCKVTLSEHWAEEVKPKRVGEKKILDGTGVHPLGSYDGASAVKVEGVGCVACGHTSADCSGDATGCIAWDTQVPSDRGYDVPMGIVERGNRMRDKQYWGCTDCHHCVYIDHTTTTTTPPPTMACASEGGSQATHHETKCVIPATFEQCHKYGSEMPGGPKSVEVGNWGSQFPQFCFVSTQENKLHIWWNNNTGDGDASPDPVGKPYEAGSCCDGSARRICCGDWFLPVTPAPTPGPPAPPPDYPEIPPLRPYSDPPPPVTIERPPTPVVDGCSVFGDPHIIQFDSPSNDKHRAFNYYAFGNYWLVKSSAVWIQARYDTINQRKPGVGYLTKVAVGGPFLEGSTIMVEGNAVGAQVWWNGDMVLQGQKLGSHSELNGNVVVDRVMPGSRRSGDQIEIKLPNDVDVLVQAYVKAGKATFLRANIKMLQLIGQDGQCGNFNGNKQDDDESFMKERGFTDPVIPSQSMIPY